MQWNNFRNMSCMWLRADISWTIWYTEWIMRGARSWKYKTLRCRYLGMIVKIMTQMLPLIHIPLDCIYTAMAYFVSQMFPLSVPLCDWVILPLPLSSFINTLPTKGSSGTPPPLQTLDLLTRRAESLDLALVTLTLRQRGLYGLDKCST